MEAPRNNIKLGIFAVGICIAENARLVEGKDGEKMVLVANEFTIEESLFRMNRWYELSQWWDIRVENDEILCYPEIELFKAHKIRIENIHKDEAGIFEITGDVIATVDVNLGLSRP